MILQIGTPYTGKIDREDTGLLDMREIPENCIVLDALMMTELDRY